MAHGGGGTAMRDLIEDVFLAAFGAGEREDQARFDLPGPGRVALTTDSFVVAPLFFPGGDIGRIAVCGTVNDLAVGGAIPVCLSAAFILEEGVEIALLRRIAASMRVAADEAGVAIVTGDTKVVERGAADQVFVTTSGVGLIPPGVDLRASAVRPGDAVLVNGPLGDHGAAILAARGDMALEADIRSDARPLAGLMRAVRAAAPGLRAARDATRGGLAAVLNEVADAAGIEIEIEEARIPVRTPVRGICEVLGLDPLYLANEGTLALFVPPEQEAAALAAMRRDEAGTESCRIGYARSAMPSVVAGGIAGRVTLRTLFGGLRIVDTLVGEQLPRIC